MSQSIKNKAFLEESSLKKHFILFREKIRSLQKKISQKKVVGMREIEGLRQITYNSGNETIRKILGEGNLSDAEVEEYQEKLATEASKLGDVDTEFCSGEQIGLQINDVILLIRSIAVESDKRELKKHGVSTVLTEKIIPLTFKDRDIYITVKDFFSLPLEFETDQNIFQQHFQYLKKILEENKLSLEDFQRLESSIDQLPNFKYKKYFNLFKRGRFNTTVLGALYEVLDTGKLGSLREE